MPKHNQDQFLLQPNFSDLIFDAFVTIPHQDCTKTITSLIHQFCYQGKRSQSTVFGQAKTQPRSIPFATKLSHLIFDAFVTISHQDCMKTTTSLIHQFCYEGKKSKSTELG